MQRPDVRYERARQIFFDFKSALEVQTDLLEELLGAFEILVEEYNPHYHENRFIAGGAAEVMLAAAMRCVGFEQVVNVGIEEAGIDIVVDGERFSIKTTWSPGSSPFGLVNNIGEAEPEWTNPTIFVIAGRGIGYADPELLPGATRWNGNQLQLRRGPLNQLHRDDPRWVLLCDVKFRPPPPEERDMADSEAVATAILHRTERNQPKFPRLRRHIRN